MASISLAAFSALTPEEQQAILNGSTVYYVVPTTPKPLRRLVFSDYSQSEISDTFSIPSNYVVGGKTVIAMQIPQPSSIGQALSFGDWVFSQVDFSKPVVTPVPAPTITPTPTPTTTPTPVPIVTLDTGLKQIRLVARILPEDVAVSVTNVDLTVRIAPYDPVLEIGRAHV